MGTVQERQPHASLNQRSRLKKAKKVQRLLSTVCRITGSQVLEVGTGSGIIAGYFSELVGKEGGVHAVDLVDQRLVRKGFTFHLVADIKLPFENDQFDICISNHVIEHVGDREAQGRHLGEIRRVLKPDGWLYLAVPNRWAFVEPHFRLPFLSWLPRGLRDSYIRLAGRGSVYDCDPPSHSELESLLSLAAFTATDVSFEGIKVVADLEFDPGFRRQLLQRPDLWAAPLKGLLPSYLYLAQPTVNKS